MCLHYFDSHTCSGETPVGSKGNSSSPVDIKVNGKTGKKKKNKNRQSAACQKKTDSVCISVTDKDQSSSSQQRPKQTKNKSARSKQEESSARSTRDQSTQTECPQSQSVQTESETPSDQGIHSPATESKSTQTRQTSFTLQQAYWGKSPTDDGSADEQAPQSNSTSNQLTVISWNIDGLDIENVHSRSQGLLSQLGK